MVQWFSDALKRRQSCAMTELGSDFATLPSILSMPGAFTYLLFIHWSHSNRRTEWESKHRNCVSIFLSCFKIERSKSIFEIVCKYFCYFGVTVSPLPSLRLRENLLSCCLFRFRVHFHNAKPWSWLGSMELRWFTKTFWVLTRQPSSLPSPGYALSSSKRGEVYDLFWPRLQFQDSNKPMLVAE